MLWFGQLVSNLPGIMTTLDDKVAHDDSVMVCLILTSSHVSSNYDQWSLHQSCTYVVITAANHNNEHLLQMLHLYAVDHALGSREPPLKKKDSEDKEKATLTQWLNQLRLSQNAINSILSLPSESELTKRARCVYVCESGLRARE